MTRILQRARRRAGTRAKGSDFLRLDEVAAVSGGLGVERAATPRMDLMRLTRAWGTVVGTHLGAATRPAWYSLGRLVVEVKDATWKRELERLAPEIRTRLETLAGVPRVDGITFRVRAARFQAIPDRGPGRRSRPAAAPPVEAHRHDLPEDLRGSLERVSDRALRERLTAVMGKYLTRAASTAH